MANKLEAGFTKADCKNLPRVDTFMVYEFISTDDRFNAPEVRGAKAVRSARTSYGDAAVGYVCVKRDGDICIVKATFCPEHKIHGKGYTVSALINEKQSIIRDIQCSGCKAALGGCKHSFSFLMWLNRRTEEPSVTDTECYWKKSSLSRVGGKNQFTLATEIRVGKQRGKKSKTVVKPVSETASNQLPDNSSFLNEVINMLIEKQVVVQLSKYKIGFDNVYNLSIHQLVSMFLSDDSNLSSDGFLTFIKNIVNEDLCNQGEKQTIDQSENILWYELRYARITGSKLYEASKCQTKEGSLVKQILGAAKLYENAPMKRGKILEKDIFRILAAKGYRIKKVGFKVIALHPIFGTSPDGEADDYIVEIKCPISSLTFKNYICDGLITARYKAQMMLQMMALYKQKGLFCVADPKFEENKILHTIWVDYDGNFLSQTMERASNFWNTSIFPVLMNLNK